MKRLAISFALLLTACAQAPVDPAFATPTCHLPSECNAKWNAAEIWINRYSGQRVTSRNETEMRTNMSQSPGNYLSVSVEMEPAAGGGSQIVAHIYCAKKVGCNPRPSEALQSFNRFVNNAWVVPDKHQREQPPGK